MITVDYWHDAANNRWNAHVRGGSATEKTEEAMRATLIQAWNREQAAELGERDFEFVSRDQ